jgi:hypothetical protein
MSDPRNVAHAKKVTQEKKHQSPEARPANAAFVQPGKKSAAPKKKRDPAGVAATLPSVTGGGESAVPSESPTARSSAALEGLLPVLAKLKEMEFHSRENLERLASMVLTVEDELKQKEIASPLGAVYSAQNDFQTKLAALIEVCQTECHRMQSEST